MKKHSTSGLTDKQERFCREYVANKGNGCQAAISAGYSKKTAQEQSSRLLLNVKVADFIKSLKEKVNKKLEVTPERIIEEYVKLGYANIADLMKEGMSFEDIKKLPRDVSAAIESVSIVTNETKFGTTTNVRIKMHSKTAALDALSKHTGVFEKDNEQRTPKSTHHTVKFED